MTPVVIALAGQMGVGKSSISRELSSILRWPRVSFGDYVRQVAETRGLGTSREVLQELGSRLIDEGWEPFVRGVIGIHPEDGGLIVDGIRHKAALDTLRAVVSPRLVWGVYLRLTDAARRQRLTQRGDDPRDIERAEAHAIEGEIEQVALICDEHVDATGSIQEVARRILDRLRNTHPDRAL
jgi:dephospho-CoA kinase